MNRLDEILCNTIDPEYEPEQLTAEEHRRIMKLIRKKTGGGRKKGRRTVRLLLAAAAVTVIAASTVFAVKQYLDRDLSARLGITESESEKFDDAFDTPVCSVSGNGITVNVLQTLSDTRTIFAVFTVTTDEDIVFGDEYFFKRERFIPEEAEKYSSFEYNVSLMSEEGRTKKYLAFISRTSIDIESGRLYLQLEDLCRYLRDENGEKLRDENYNYVTETVKEGSWDLLWEYNSDITTDIKEIDTDTKVMTVPGEGEPLPVWIKKIVLSPLSAAVDFEIEGDWDTGYADLPFDVNFSDGTKLSSDELKRNLAASYDGSMGHVYARFSRIADIDNIESITIGDSVIPVK